MTPRYLLIQVFVPRGTRLPKRVHLDKSGVAKAPEPKLSLSMEDLFRYFYANGQSPDTCRRCRTTFKNIVEADRHQGCRKAMKKIFQGYSTMGKCVGCEEDLPKKHELHLGMVPLCYVCKTGWKCRRANEALRPENTQYAG